MKKVKIAIKSPGDTTKLFKEINKATANARSKVIRKRAIDTAYFIRDSIAKNAPKRVYEDIIMGTPLERHYNYNSGFDVDLSASGSFEFTLKLSTHRLSSKQYGGYNPMWGLLVSNYGRGPITTSRDNPMPIADTSNQSNSKIDYNHPVYGLGYNNRYAGEKVAFVTHVKGVQGTHWIEQALQSSTRKANNILAGKTKYENRDTKDTYWS